MDPRLPQVLLLALCCACSTENDGGSGGAGESGAAGGGASGAGGSGGAALDPACTALAQAACDAFASCAPILIDVFYGSAALCLARHEITCGSELAAPDTGYSASIAASCADAYMAATCDGMLGAIAGACAPPVGDRLEGGPCATHAQCASGYCRNDPAGTTGCGACSPRVAALAACDTDPSACAPGTTCAGAICQPFASRGASCAAGEPCDLGLLCFAGVCEQGNAVGQPCDDVSPCDAALGLGCVAGVCTAPVLAAPGASCVPPEGQPAPICTASSACAANGTCRPPAEDGAPCGGAPGIGCYAPARCGNGACVLPDQLTCEAGTGD